jgi:ketosteroid isomerase-like protein
MNKLLIILSLFLTACTTGVNKSRIETARKEIAETERAFEAMAKEKGLSEAFSYYADSAAALNRGSYVVHGKDSIRLFYQAPRYNEVHLEWKPDFVEVSASADLGYSYGKFTFTTHDSAGQVIVSKGIFHTVWKKQADGQWRFVWD